MRRIASALSDPVAPRGTPRSPPTQFDVSCSGKSSADFLLLIIEHPNQLNFECDCYQNMTSNATSSHSS